MNIFSESDLSEISSRSLGLGFSDVKFLPVIDPEESFQSGYREYLSKNYHAKLHYLENTQAKFSSAAIYDKANTMAIFTLPYLAAGFIEKSRKHRYCISAYATGRDYHLVVKEKLQKILDDYGPGRIVCDTTPLPERFYARRAGLGFTGKNSMLIHPVWGSYFFLAFILFSRELPDKKNSEKQFILNQNGIARDIQKFCGNCHKCMDACPGGALDGSGFLDSRRCYSFWSIENRNNSIDYNFKKINSLFGCDICQQVCPYNNQPLMTTISEFQVSQEANSIMDGSFENLSLKGTPFQRTGIKGLVRNFNYINRQAANGGLTI